MHFRLLSLQVGQARTHGAAGAADPLDQPWTSAFVKEPVAGPVSIHALGLEGDAQVDRVHHGGPDKAINAYPADHYEFWRTELGLELGAGAFAENFTTHGLTEAAVCIGDTFRVGPVLVQISQPRQPCGKLNRRWHRADLVQRVDESLRCGWYFRVLEGGLLAAPADFILEERPHPEWTVAAAYRVMMHRHDDLGAAAALARCPALSESWREDLRRRVAAGA